MPTARPPRTHALLLIVALLATTGCALLPLGAALERLEGRRGAATVTPVPAQAAVQTPALPLSGDEAGEDLAALYERVIPAVVSIRVIRPTEGLLPVQPLPEGNEEYTQGQGSGFVVDAAERLVVTNNHVIEDAELIEVLLHDGTVLRGELLGRDPDADLAVVRLAEGEGSLREVLLGDSRNLRVGQRAIAIGNPFGWRGTMTVGIISGLGRTLNLGHSSGEVGGARFSIPQMIQTDAAINYGNSGGPLLDAAGRVIGVNTAMNSVTGLSGGVGFAVPIHTVERVLPALVAEGRYAYPWLGVTGTDVQPVHVAAMDLPVERGAMVTDVVPDGPAGRAGLRGADRAVDYYGTPVRVGGDVIVAVEDAPVRQFDDLLVYLVENASPGDRVTLTLIRDGEERTVRVTLGERPGD